MWKETSDAAIEKSGEAENEEKEAKRMIFHWLDFSHLAQSHKNNDRLS